MARDWQRWFAPFRRNLFGKVFALAVAFILWLFVNAGKRETQVVQFPIEFRNTPQSSVLVTRERIDSVSVKLNGPSALLTSVDGRRAPIVLDLAKVGLGEDARLKINDDMVRVPRGVRILDIEPSRIPIRLEEIRRATVPVRLIRAGELPDGYKVDTVRLTPSNVVVTGPASIVEGLQVIETEPLDLSGTTAPISRAVALVRGEHLLSITPERVMAQIGVEQVRTTRDLKRVTVDVRNVDRPFQLRPTHVNLTVRGPERAVQGLELDPGSVYVDGAQFGVGEHTVEPAVVLPAGIELVKREPATLSLEILEKKNGARK
jgi:YbbR domain-containing protein